MLKLSIHDDDYTASNYTSSSDDETNSNISFYISKDSSIENNTPTAQLIDIPLSLNVSRVINDCNVSPITSSPLRYRFTPTQHNYDIESLNDLSISSMSSQSYYTTETNSIISLNSMTKRRKLFTITTSLLILLFHFINIPRSKDPYNDTNLMMGVISVWPYCNDHRGYLWKLVSNILVHHDNVHVIGNVILFYISSYSIEITQYGYLIAPVFFIGVIQSNLLYYYVQPYSFSLGASAGSFTMLGANAANIIINFNTYHIIFNGISLIIIFIVLLNESLNYNEDENIAYIAHWMGCVSGFVGALSFFRYYYTYKFNTLIRYIALTIYVSITLLLIINYSTNYPPLQSYNNVLKKIDTFNCCYEWFQFKNDNPYAEFSDYTCPYTIVYSKYIYN